METPSQLLKRLDLPQAEWISLRQVREKTVSRTARDEKPEENTTSLSQGIMVEVMAKGQVGYSATPHLQQGAIREAAEAALAQALSAAEKSVFPFKAADRLAAQGRYSSPVKKPLSALTPGEINAILIRACRELKVGPKIVRTVGSFHTSETEVRYASTAGADWEQNFTRISTHFEATAQDGSLVQQRSDQGGFARSYQAGLEVFDNSELWGRIRKVGEQALELLSAEECPTETTSLVLMPDQMILQIHESIGHPLELDRIIGDERNYAGWSFVKPQDFGTLQYGSSQMNVTFDPTVPGEFASYSFDDSGVPAQREYLIENGVLVRGLGSLESQLRSRLPGVANSRSCSWNRAPIDRMANLNLEPGNLDFDDIIGSIERGVIMESNRSWSIDDFRNKFQFGCEYARLIEGGRITRTLRNPNYKGITVPFWNGLKQVGNRSTFEILGTPNCGKGEPNQIIRVGHASPVCHFDKVEVFGGGN